MPDSRSIVISPTSPSGEDPSVRYVAYVVGLLTVVNLVNYMDRMALAVLLPDIKADLALSDGQLGLLIGLAFALFYAIGGIPIARWADRGIRRDIIAVAIAVWSVMTALSGAAQNFWHLFLARVGVGAGEAGNVPTAQSMLCDYVPFKRRSGVLAFHNFGLFAGTTVGMALAGWLSEVIGWRWTLVALGAPGLILAVIIKLTLREPTRGRFDVADGDRGRKSMRDTLAALWQCKTYRLLLLVNVVMGFTQAGLGQWWPSFYARTFALNAASVGVYLGTAIGVGSGLGILLGGWAGSHVARRDIRLPIWIGTTGYLLALPAALASLWVSSPLASLIWASLTNFCWSAATGPVLAATYSVIPSRMRAMAGALMIFFMSAVGFALGPWCVGALSDLLTPSFGTEALRYALLAPLSLIPVAVIASYGSARTLLADLGAVGIQVNAREAAVEARGLGLCRGVLNRNTGG